MIKRLLLLTSITILSAEERVVKEVVAKQYHYTFRCMDRFCTTRRLILLNRKTANIEYVVTIRTGKAEPPNEQGSRLEVLGIGDPDEDVRNVAYNIIFYKERDAQQLVTEDDGIVKREELVFADE
jgi:hypothetical protein